jgi:hypothetical protein
MPKRVLSRQELLESVHSATGVPFESIYPSDRCYLALSLAEVWETVQSFGPNLANGEKEDCDHLARRLWYAFKEKESRCACGMVRLSEPIARDVVGIVTADDLLSDGTANSAGLDDCVLSDDLAEYVEEGFAGRLGLVPRDGGPRSSFRGGAEMTLIDPQNRDVFKRSQGGTFGPGQWRVSEIKALAVWF